MMMFRSWSVLVFILFSASCTTAPVADRRHEDLGLLWVKHAAEYEALSRQVYQAAELALPGFIEDQSWTALPGQEDAEGLRPAIIFDVDETIASNVDFQMTYERPFENWKHYEWSRSTPALPVPGFAGFAEAARAAGVELFFITGRPCELVAGNTDPCPQLQSTIDDVREAGIETDADHVFLVDQRDGWTKEKATRRQHVAKTHRVIMLFGDDLGDFMACMRAKPAAPCGKSATAESRKLEVAAHSRYWGNGWYVLPNPMHGSWTSQL